MIIDMQRRLAEIGRIRIGQQVPIGTTGKTRPAKLDTFRLTSANRDRIEDAARLYGGTVNEWQSPTGQQWEVITDTNRLNVIVPPGDMAFSQFYELWSGGGCQRRCDGRYATFNDNGNIADGECLCDPDQRECQIHTRLSVLLRDLNGLGLWRLDSQGWNAALELQGAVDILMLAAGRGQMLPAQLRLEQRMVKRPGQQTRRFAVPVLDIEISPGQLLGGGNRIAELPPPPNVSDGLAPGKNGSRTGERSDPPSLQANDMPSPSLTPVPDTVPEWPTPTVAEQIAEEKPPPRKRSKSKAPFPTTGIAPRTAEQAKAAVKPTPEQRAEMEAYIDETQPGLIDDLGITRTEDEPPWEDKMADSLDHLDPPPPITNAQLTKLAILLRENVAAGREEGARQARHDFVAECVQRRIESAKDLTKDEASYVIDTLENRRPEEPQWEPGHNA